MNEPFSAVKTTTSKPSSPLILLGVLLITTAGVSLVPASWIGRGTVARSYEPLSLGSLAQADVLAPDGNNDGIVSWKEYVANSLNIKPLNPGESSESDPAVVASLNDPNNLTSSFSKNLFVASVALRDSGISDAKREQETMNQLMKLEASKITPTTYTANNVSVSNDTSKAALKTYGNSVASIMDGLITETTITDDLTSLALFTQTRNENDLSPLLINANNATVALSKLIALKVPQNAVTIHLQTLNAVGTYANTLRDAASAYNDALRATFAVKRYSEDVVAALRVIPTVGAFLMANTVTFSSNEPGNIYTSGYTGDNQ